jgi:UDP-N-acetylglucosamine--N-acetylmuramyl-(pentapeptide) pyrophosphoryl-undecaprenol N-acetylglucosamine transferase
MPVTGEQLNVAIACGGTGGHLFPGLAVAGELSRRGARVTLMVSPKEVDQLAVKGAEGFEVVTLPAVGLTGGRMLAFFKGFLRSYRAAVSCFSQKRPQAVLAMGGFTSAPPVLAGRRFRAAAFLHESNSIPGRANRWLSWRVERAFIGFPAAARQLHTHHVSLTGTPVRPKFQPLDPAGCRAGLGLDPARPVALVIGGSQGAHGVNELILRSLPLMAQTAPDWQWIHLAGSADVDELRSRYSEVRLAAVVHSFFTEMERAMGAATASISRAGASSLAELAAMRLPALLIPFPAATDNHQLHNARAFEVTGAARLLEQRSARPDALVNLFGELMRRDAVRHPMQAALAAWHRPHAAAQIAQTILESIRLRIQPHQSSFASKSAISPDDLGTRFSAISEWSERSTSAAYVLTKGGVG